jgi:hypothetical protein
MKWSIVIKFILGLISLCYVGLTNAAVYQVEMIIFSHLTTSGVTQEQWPSVNPPPSFADALPLQNSNASGYYQALGSNEFILQREQAEFNRNGGYRTLVHAAWLQPFTGSSAPTIHIFGGNNYDANGQTQYAVNGTVRVTVNRYFNAAFNLYFAVPENMLARYDNRNYFHNTNNLVYFHLTETRRMKSHELNYIDYPLFGVLIKIVPIKATT